MNKSNLEMIGVSALTASILGLKKIETIAKSEQAYFMIGNKCLNSCSFCSQSRSIKGENSFLSRVSWPIFPLVEVIDSLKNNNTIKKACFQVVGSYNYFDNFIEILKKFKSSLDIPFGASIDVYSIEQIDILFEKGLLNIGIALDAASNEVYKNTKKKNISFDKMLDLITESAKKYPNKITVHLIIGLGETDFDLINLFNILKKENVNIALFAFTPLKGTQMQFYPKVELERYRYIQFLREIYKKASESDFEKIVHYINFSENNMIESFSKKILEFPYILEILNSADYMKTSGCPLCNRPYYNDKPLDKDLYNFHFNPPTEIIENWKEKILEKIL
jgi:biotin synthase